MKTKGIITAAMLVIATALCYADPIDFESAQEAAKRFVKDGNMPVLLNNGKSYYIFSRGQGQGFVVVGGDDLLPEIIGYTNQGDFDETNMPEGLRNMLHGYDIAMEKYQADVEEHGETAVAAAKAKAKARRSSQRRVKATTDLGPLMTSSWEQGWPYYDYCPWDTQNNARSLTGCVATSTSSVIHYWRRDNPRYLMTGTHAYTTWTNKLEVNPGYAAGHPMKWELMKDNYNGSNYGSWNDNYTCVSELMAIVGDLVDMDYSSNGSGAQSSNQPKALGAFNLTGTNTWYSGIGNMDTWEEMIQGDLMKNRPILYSGYSVDSNNKWSGHSFVIDGYQLSDDKYHIDFGWGDNWKGFWEISDCGGYNTDQSMTYLIYPKRLNLTAQISAPTFLPNTANAVTVTVQNNGTLDYTEGINLFCSTSPNQPAAWGTQKSDPTTIPTGGYDVVLTFTVNPGSGESWYLIVTDKDFHVLARVKVPTTETMEEVTSAYVRNPSFESYDNNGKPTGWTLGGEGQYARDPENWVYRAVGHDGNRVLDSWVSGNNGYGISQTLSGLPVGYYRLTAKVATDSDKTVTVFANDKSVTTGAHECGKYYLKDITIDRIQVSDAGTIKIGINPGSWYKADDFRLYRYLSTPEETAAITQDPAKGQTTLDLTNTFSEWLSTSSVDAYTNNGFKLGSWGDYSGSDDSSLSAPFIEKWTATGNMLDNADLQQTIRNLPNGTYYIGGSFIATSQGFSNDHVEGITFWAEDQSISLATGNGAPERYSLKVQVTNGTLTFGLRTDCTNANWVAMDNLFLLWAGDRDSYYRNILNLCETAQQTHEQAICGAASSALAQYRWTPEESAQKSDEEIQTAIRVLRNAADIAAAGQTATRFILNADFQGNIVSASVQGSGGRVNYPGQWNFEYSYSGWNDTFVDKNNKLFNAWAGGITLAQLSQSVADLPNGQYRLSADIRVDNPQTSSQTTLFGTSQKTTNSSPAGSDVAGSTTNFAKYSVNFDVTGNTATIGIVSQKSFYQVKNFALEFVPAIRGDVNGDNILNSTDITALANIITGKTGTHDKVVSDVNRDGSVTIADITSLVNLILGK